MDAITLTSWLTVANLLLLVSGAIGGILAFRSSFSNAEHAVESRVREILKDENAALQDKVGRLEKEVARFGKTLRAIQRVLEDQGMHMEVNNDVISLTDARRTRGKTVYTRIDSDELKVIEKKEQ